MPGLNVLVSRDAQALRSGSAPYRVVWQFWGNLMSTTIAVEEAQANLKQLIDQLSGGDEIIITDNHRRVAKLVADRPPLSLRPGPGLCKGMIAIVADDEEQLKDFAEYMP